MSDPDGLFRPEAVEHHRRPSGPGPLVTQHRPWVSWLYRLMLGLLVVGVVAAARIRIDDRTVFEMFFR